MIAQQGLFLMGSTDHPSEVQGIEAFNFTPRGGPPTQSGLASLFSPGERSRGRPPYIDFCAIVIPTPVKGRMLRHLAGTYNKTEARIYPDLAGFSSALHRLSVELEGAPRRSRTVRQDLEEQQLREFQSSPVWHELQRPLA
ncbi:hypothetical protein [Austwickia chelonae]|uniref:hypothetical protein n=1 Tax=Austwickia chelonae TaxID=100225 RepID=UPI001F07E42C|nr:hypothetical protein [Austwickia chelonae]